MKSFAAVATGALALASSAAAGIGHVAPLFPRAVSLPSVTVSGNAFFVGNSRFYIRGVDWQPGGSSNLADPLADTTTCTRDIAQFKTLGVNTVRVYTVDNSANHDACMQMLASAGIYLVLDVNTPNYSINRAEPAISYNAVYLQNIFATIDAFAQYSNTLAFFSGNEVINDDSTTSAAPFVKAVTRDMRQYIRARAYRLIPVGYSAADVDSNRMQMAAYMNCGTNDERSDFFAFNDYSWCDPSSFVGSGWSQKVKNFTGYGLPIFLSEYGCIKPGPRTWQEVTSLYSTDMSAVYSGGIGYEYSEEGNGYGLGTIESSSSYSPGAGFTYLQKALANTPNPSGDGGYSSTQAVSQCPTQSSNWNVTWGSLLPAMPSGAVTFLTSGAGKGVGLSGPGSQTAGTIAVVTASPGSGSATAGAALAQSTSSKGAAPGALRPAEYTPLYISAVIAMSTMIGALML